ncbi:MAG: hypothetical protein M3Y91_13315 [Actinomycetota bacterium]|nr:hypothetical protein [Actinomycetota bacterium]
MLNTTWGRAAAVMIVDLGWVVVVGRGTVVVGAAAVVVVEVTVVGGTAGPAASGS